MSTVIDQSTLFLDATFISWQAKYMGSQGLQAMMEPSPTYTPTATFLRMDSDTPLTTGFHTYFKIQGYNTTTRTYETWHCRDVPILLPPSGHNLQNVSVIATWIDR